MDNNTSFHYTSAIEYGDNEVLHNNFEEITEESEDRIPHLNRDPSDSFDTLDSEVNLDDSDSASSSGEEDGDLSYRREYDDIIAQKEMEHVYASRKKKLGDETEFLDTVRKIGDDFGIDSRVVTEQAEALVDTVKQVASVERAEAFLDTVKQVASDSIPMERTRTLDTIETLGQEDIESFGYEKKKRPNSPALKKKKRCCDKWTCLLLIVILICCLVAGSIGAALFIFGEPNPLLFLSKDTEDIEIGDIDMSTYKYDRWETKIKHSGLELYIENALDDKWSPYLQEYEALYDEAEPNSLSLKLLKVQEDSECTPSLGRLKVCNGNYGDTNWEGINLSLVNEGYIKWSTSKMNDYFLDKQDEDRKKYTMCHELGHGFGLSHSDEDYHNRNRGDCMDYTNRPEGNLLPGKFNHEVLKRIYGTIPPRRRRDLEESKESVPDEIVDRFFEAELEMMSPEGCTDGECIKEIGEGYYVVAHMLLVDRN